MALRLFRYSFVASLVVIAVATCVQAGVLQLAPISEVGVAQELGVSGDTAAWVSKDGAQGECFAGSGAVISGECVAEVSEASDEVTSEEVLVSVTAEPSRPAAAKASVVVEDQPGDVNGDGYVNQSDVDILASNWQYGVTGTANATREMGDLNDDGKVDGADVTILAYYWGAKPISVPEPSTIVILLCGIVGLVISRRCRQA